jgi:hypothetical protein
MRARWSGIVRQYAENEHRTGLTTTDRLGVVEQLALLNVSAAQIAKRTRMKRPQVDQALAVTRSDLAKAASVRYELTIDQAAAVAEFDDDAEVVKALVAAAKTGQFAHVLERARQDRDDAAQRAQAEADLAATGVRVIEAPGWSGAAKALGWQVCDAEGSELTAEQHAACPGHVGWVVQDWVTVDAEGRVYTDDEIDALDAAADDSAARGTASSPRTPTRCCAGSQYWAAKTPPRTIRAQAVPPPAVARRRTPPSLWPMRPNGPRPRARSGGG